MNFDIVLAGVGGQGVLSLSGIIASGAMKEGLFVKQSEVHGMSQRGERFWQTSGSPTNPSRAI